MNKYLIQNENVYSLAETVANKICGLVQSGTRYNEIVLTLCDFDDTAEIYAAAFARFNIPTNIDIGTRLLDTPEVKHIRDGLLNAPWQGGLGGERPEIIDKVNSIKTTISTIMSGIEIPKDEYLNLFCTLCAAQKISAVPRALDRVLITPTAEWAPEFTKYVFIAGASMGNFPEQTPDTDIITMQDVANMTIRIDPTPKLQNARAMQHAKNIIGAATDTAFLCAAHTNTAGQKTTKSPLAKLFTPDADTEIYSPEYAKTVVLTALGNGSAFESIQSAEYFKSLETAANVRVKIPNLNQSPQKITPEIKSLSVTEIENYIKCPYYWFVTNVLKLRKPDPKNIIPPHVIGTMLHEFLEQYLKTGKFITLPKNLQSHAKRLAKWIESDLKDAQFQPAEFEKRIETTVENVKIRGVIDRVDCDKSGNKIVIDYKTGGAGIVKIQVPFYAHAIRETDCATNPPDIAGYYLNLRDFTKKQIDSQDIPPAVTAVKDAVTDIKRGIISPKPLHKSVCEYCPNATFCGGAK